MNADKILNMPAGKEIDYLIDNKVFGMVNISTGNPFESDLIPNYSTNMSDAWKVVEKSLGDLFDFELGHDETQDNVWSCVWWKRGEKEFSPIYASAQTAPLAICRAALLAVVPAQQGGV
ncbi:MAG: hypothetical protein HY865_00980 [Chloroflexi bacterium]|nr:hypothetical protein [Chloroflexota bacterium]